MLQGRAAAVAHLDPHGPHAQNIASSGRLSAIAVDVFFIGSIFTPWAVVWGTPPITVALIGWFWPKGLPEDET